MNLNRPASWGGALVAVASAVWLLIGLRSIAAVDGLTLVSLLGVDALPRESLGIEWSSRAIWPAHFQDAALVRLIGTLASLFLATATIATLNALILVAEAATARRREFAVRAALGATPAVLARMLLSELRTLVTVSAVLGLMAGMTSGAATRMLWPGALAPATSVPTSDLVVGLLLLLGLLATAHMAGAWQTTRSGRAASDLKSGARVGGDPVAVFVRKVLAAGHTAVAGAVLVSGWTLFGGLANAAKPADAPRTIVIGATAPSAGAWTAALAAVRAVPGIEAESLAAPGALIGLGIRDIAIAECGACARGGLPAPLWNALADHHVVAPGYFDLAGLDVVEGRPFSAEDDADSAPVVVISRAFARSSFEKGRPLGKRIRIGTGFDRWYRVVGIVEDWNLPVLGAERSPREAVYLSALQNPPRSAHLLLRGDEAAITSVAELLTASGFDPEVPLPLSEVRAAAAAPLRWANLIALFLGGAALVLAGHGIYVTALQTTRRRTTDLAIRRAVGAPARRIVTYVLGERLRVTGWGLAGFVFLGTLSVAFLQGATGLPAPSPLAFMTIGSGLAAVAMAASIRAAREALTVDPGQLLE